MRAILTYHSIDDSGSVISVAPAVLRAQLTWLARSGTAVVPVDRLLAMPPGASAVAITFDDGFANVAQHAEPVLTDLALPATIFVVSDHVGGTNAWGGRGDPGIAEAPLLDWHDLERLVGRGIAVGAHTRRHPHLTSLPEHAVEEELDACATAIEQHLGARPAGLAYPYGDVNAMVRHVAAARFAWACTTELAGLDGGVDAAMLPRIDMYYFRRPGAFERWGSPAFERELDRRRRLRRVGSWLRSLRGQVA